MVTARAGVLDDHPLTRQARCSADAFLLQSDLTDLVAAADSDEARLAIIVDQLRRIEAYTKWLLDIRAAYGMALYQDGREVTYVAMHMQVSDSLVSRIAREFGLPGRRSRRSRRRP